MIIDNLIVMSYHDSHFETIWCVLAILENSLKFIDMSDTEEGAHDIIASLQEKARSLISENSGDYPGIRGTKAKLKGH